MATKLFLQNFTVLDFAFLCPLKGLQGESFHVSATLSGELDHQGFVMDFGRVKKLLKAKVDELVDHRIVVAEAIPGLSLQKSEYPRLNFKNWSYQAPREAFTFLSSGAVSEATIQIFLVEEIKQHLPSNVHSIEFSFASETRFNDNANFRYTHGLRLHDGNCQRLFHGHRNLIEVFENQQKRADLAQELAEFFADAHFANAATVKNISELDLVLESREKLHPGIAEIVYLAPQGKFVGSLPASTLILLDREPSIENIAALGKRILEKKYPGLKIAVMAYEGLNKGALAE